MAEKEYVCGYSHCLHHGEKVPASNAVMIGKKRFHWDCAAHKQQMARIRNTYFTGIDKKAKFQLLAKVLNDLVYRYEVDIDYVEFCVNYYAEYKTRIKSPLTLLFIRDNKTMKRKWEISKKAVSGC